MGYSAKVYEKVKQDFEQFKMVQIRRRNMCLEEVYKKIPKIEEMDKEISIMGSQMVSLILENPGRAKEFTEMVKEKLLYLKEERKKLLVSGGFPEDYTDIHYNCPFCEDTGYNDGKECECFKIRLREEAYKESNLCELLKTQSFDKFNLYLFSDEKVKGVSPRDIAKQNLDFCKKYAKNFKNEEKGLFMYGGAGLGKTFLSVCIAKEVIDDGGYVIYNSAVTMFGNYMDYIFNRISSPEARKEIESLKECDLLIIDDLGAEATNNQMTAFLFELLNDRILAGRKTIINTNYNLSEIAKTYSERIHSRLMQYFDIMNFKGEDLREKF